MQEKKSEFSASIRVNRIFGHFIHKSIIHKRQQRAAEEGCLSGDAHGVGYSGSAEISYIYQIEHKQQGLCIYIFDVFVTCWISAVIKNTESKYKEYFKANGTYGRYMP